MTKSRLFSEHELQGLTLRNRLVRSATWEGMADPQGKVTPSLETIYRALAEGGVGLLISGFTNVLPEGNAFPGCLGLFHDDQIESVRRLVDVVHLSGGTLCLQLGHGGGQCSRKSCGTQPLAPSSVQAKQYPELPREMSPADIERAVAAFASASARAREAGCDAVQLHAAHGYLLNQFLSPLTNHRRDQYGGDLEGRSRFLLETVAAVRQAVGRDFPLLVKLNGSDNLKGGLSVEDACEVARQLDAAGIAALEISGGTPASDDQGPVQRAPNSGDEFAYNATLARTVRQQVKCPIITVGGIRSLAVMRGLLCTGQADYISLSRPLVREPDLPHKLQSGVVEKSTCSSCNGCFKAALRGKFSCVQPSRGI